MDKVTLKNKFIKLKNFFYEKLFRINDTPQKIAIGFGLGVFAGILPGLGPLAALFLAFLFRSNRASALLGSLLTNTWLSVATFILSIKVGSSILGLNWQEVYRECLSPIRNFHWLALFKLSLPKIILPVFIGYLIVASLLGLLFYLVCIIIILKVKPRIQK